MALPGTGGDKLISLQLDSRHRPCSILEAISLSKKVTRSAQRREATPTFRPTRTADAAASDPHRRWRIAKLLPAPLAASALRAFRQAPTLLQA